MTDTNTQTEQTSTNTELAAIAAPVDTTPVDPPVSFEAAITKLAPEMKTFLDNAFTGFANGECELGKRSKKNIFAALAATLAAYGVNEQGISTGSVSRRLSRAGASLRTTQVEVVMPDESNNDD